MITVKISKQDLKNENPNCKYTNAVALAIKRAVEVKPEDISVSATKTVLHIKGYRKGTSQQVRAFMATRNRKNKKVFNFRLYGIPNPKNFVTKRRIVFVEVTQADIDQATTRVEAMRLALKRAFPEEKYIYVNSDAINSCYKTPDVARNFLLSAYHCKPIQFYLEHEYQKYVRIK